MKVTLTVLAASLVASPSPFFGRDVPPASVPLFSIARSESCVPANAQSAGATVSVASMLVPQNASRAYEHAEKALARGNFDDAERTLEKALAIYPKSAIAWCLMGTLHEEKLELEDASGDYSRALVADRRMIAAYLGLARIAFRNKRWQDVVELTDEVVRINADAFPVAHLYNAAAQLQTGDLKKAERSAREFQCLDTGHERPQVYLLLADILTAERDYAGAAEQEKTFLTIVPNPGAVPNGRDAESIRQEIKILEARSMEKMRSTMSPHLAGATAQTPFR